MPTKEKNENQTSAVTVAVLMIGTLLVMVTASFLVHAVTPKQGDPIPGIDVSIEQSPGGIIIASTQTNAQGIATFANIGPGKYIVKTWIRPGQVTTITLQNPIRPALPTQRFSPAH